MSKHPLGWLCHLSGWKRILEKTFHHIEGHYLARIENGEIQAGLPLYEVKSWLTGNKLVSIPYATLSDPLIATESDMKTLLDEGIKLNNALGRSHIEIGTFASHEMIGNNLMASHCNYKQHYLLLDKKPEEIKKSFDRTCVRQRISRAMKSNLIVRKGFNEDDLKSFYQLYVMTRKKNGLPPQPYKFIKAIWGEFNRTGNVTLLLVEHDKSVIGGILLFKFKKRVSLEYAASNNEYLNLSPNHLLYWEAIKSAFEEGYEVFDFGRTNINNYGLMDFKKRWGTTVVDLPTFYYPNDTISNSGTENSLKYKLVNKICRNLPDVALKAIGNFVYRHN